MKNHIRQKLISVVLSVADVILFYVTENAHIRIHHHSVGFDHGLPRARSTGKLKTLCILYAINILQTAFKVSTVSTKEKK